MLQERNIIVIGGTSGLGFQASKTFLKNGANVVAAGLHNENVAQADKLQSTNYHTLISDARQEDTAEQAISYCTRTFGSVHGLYHVAGGSGRSFGDGALHELTLEGWNKTIELNLSSVMLSNRAAVRYFLRNRIQGSILNMGSVLAYAPSPSYFATHAYAAAKSAIIGFSKSIAAYYAKHQIRVNVIAPSLVETPMAARAIQDPAIMAYIRGKQPLDGGRIGRTSDFDGLALYFMSDQSKFTTGQVIAVDGGWHLSEGGTI